MRTFKKLCHILIRKCIGPFLCIGIQVATAQTSPGVSDTEILIGQSCQLSGPLAALSSEVRQGASLYFDHVNASGGIRGRKINQEQGVIVATVAAYSLYVASATG